MQCHEVDYEIFGDDMQIVEIELDPRETVIAEAGAMNYMEQNITFETKMGDGSKPIGGILDSLMHVGKRVLTGESIFMTHFSNSGSGKQRVAFAAPYPGKLSHSTWPLSVMSLSARRMRFFVPRWAPRLTSPFKRNWVPVFLVARVLYCSACEVMAWRSFTLAVP